MDYETKDLVCYECWIKRQKPKWDAEARTLNLFIEAFSRAISDARR
jgi:hypothetical protein